MQQKTQPDFSILLIAIVILFALVGSGAFTGAKPFGSEMNRVKDTVIVKR